MSQPIYGKKNQQWGPQGGGGFGPFGRQPPSQIAERRKTGFVSEVIIPFTMATILAVVTVSLIAAIGYASMQSTHVALLAAIVFCLFQMGWIVLVSIRWMVPVSYAWYGVILTLCATGLCYAIARVIAEFQYELPSLLWIVASGVELFWLTIAFGLELTLRSPAMEEHGFRELFAWFFQFWLRREREPERPVKVGDRDFPPTMAKNGQHPKPFPIDGQVQSVEETEEEIFLSFFDLFLEHSAKCGRMLNGKTGQLVNEKGALTRDVLTGHPMPGGSRLRPRKPKNSHTPGWEECIAYLMVIEAVEKPGKSYEWVGPCEAWPLGASARIVRASMRPDPPPQSDAPIDSD